VPALSARYDPLCKSAIGIIARHRTQSARCTWNRHFYGAPMKAVVYTESVPLDDAGVLRTTLAGHFGTINAANLRRAHALLESGKARGKIVLSGF
jgi:hypothetical protein